MKFDYLLIGQGLAGSSLAYQLSARGKRIAIFDEQKERTSSRVAAGLANPLTGPKMVKTWKADVLFPYMKEFYQRIERETGTKFFTEKIIYRPFTSAGEINDWYGRSSEPDFATLVRTICEKNAHSEYIHDPFGGIEINGAHLDVPGFLLAVSKIMSSQCTFFPAHFDEERLTITDNGVRYEDIEADHLVYCTGHSITRSKFFGWLPVSSLKGEILTIKPEKDFETIYNRSCFIIPLGNGDYKLGSTYKRNDLSEETTETGKIEICQKLEALSSMNYSITEQMAGIRPVTVARRPILGTHPEHSSLHIFNGLGTKGVTLAPFFSNQMADFLVNGRNMDEEVNIKKYISLYFGSHFNNKIG